MTHMQGHLNYIYKAGYITMLTHLLMLINIRPCNLMSSLGDKCGKPLFTVTK